MISGISHKKLRISGIKLIYENKVICRANKIKNKTMNESKVGSLWERQVKNGVPFMSGELLINGKTVKIVAFRNKARMD